MLYEFLHWLWLFGEGEPEVPPPPPLPVRMEVDATEFYARRWLAGPLFAPETSEEAGLSNRPETSPEVAHVVEMWANALKEPKPRTLELDRYVYDSVFGRELRTHGQASFDGESGRIGLASPRDLPETNPHRNTRSGGLFEVVSGNAERITFDGRTVMDQDLPDGFRYRIDVPVGWNAEGRPIPMMELLEPFRSFDPARRCRSFHIEFGTQHQAGKQIHLVLTGRSRTWRQQFQRVEVLLKAESFAPIAIRWIDIDGTRETVCVYKLPLQP